MGSKKSGGHGPNGAALDLTRCRVTVYAPAARLSRPSQCPNALVPSALDVLGLRLCHQHLAERARLLRQVGA